MDNFDLSSDYRMLEELTRNVEIYKKTLSRKFFRANKELPHVSAIICGQLKIYLNLGYILCALYFQHLYRLGRQATVHKTKLKFLPSCFVKRKQNTTYLNFKSNIIYWHIEWIFVNADNLKVIDEKVTETEKLSSILHKYLVKQEDTVLQEKLQYYQACGMTGIRIFLKAEECAGDKYYELDALETLRDNFRNKAIVEYPSLYVVLKEHANVFTVIEPGKVLNDPHLNRGLVGYNFLEESSKKTNMDQCNANIVDNIIKSAEADENLYSSLKNLLFISEYSDGEMSAED